MLTAPQCGAAVNSRGREPTDWTLAEVAGDFDLYGKGASLECLALVEIQPKRCRSPAGFATALETGARAAWSAAASEARRRFG